MIISTQKNGSRKLDVVHIYFLIVLYSKYLIFDISNPKSQTGESFREKSMLEDFRANVLRADSVIYFVPAVIVGQKILPVCLT